jgi:hypothetical protein
MPRAAAAPLIALSHRIAHEGACAQSRDIAKLQRQAVALVNARRVPADLAEPLISGVNALAERPPLCMPSVPSSGPTAVTTPTEQAQPPRREHHDDHKPHKEKHH